jgi:hypothetical protein
MVQNKSKKIVMFGATAIALAAVAGVTIVGSGLPSVVEAADTYTITFNSTNRPFSGSVSASTYQTDQSGFSSYAYAGHDTIKSAAILTDTAKFGSVIYPDGCLVAATVGTTKPSSYYEAYARLVIGLNNITSFSASVAKASSMSYNALYCYFYSQDFTLLDSKVGTATTTTISGSYDGSKVVARWLVINYAVNSSTPGASTDVANKVYGAAITSVTVSWSC